MDIKTLVQNLKDFCGSLTNLSDNIPLIKKYFMNNMYQWNIMFNLEEVPTDHAEFKRIRVNLSSNRQKADFTIPLVRQCNGVIIEISESTTSQDNKFNVSVLAMPIHEFNNGFAAVDIEYFLRKNMYQIYEVQDGTTFNLYYDKLASEWVYSTKKSFDIYDNEWRNYSYKFVIEDTLSQYPDFKLENLDKSLTYSIGIKHPAHHPFGQPFVYDPNLDSANWIKKAWLISANNIDTSTKPNIGLPIQEPINVDFLSKPGKKFKHLMGNCSSSMKNFLKDGTQFLGYILRSTNPETSAFSDILIESNLFTELKKLIYDIPFITSKVARLKIKNNFKNMNYVVLNSWLNFTKRKTFFVLFPQYKNYAKMFEDVIDRTVKWLLTQPEQAGELETTLGKKLLPHIQVKMTIPKPSPQDGDYNVVKMLIMNPKYTDIYMSVIEFGI